VNAHDKRSVVFLLGSIFAGLFLVGTTVSGQVRPGGSDSAGAILLALMGGHEEIIFACRQEGHDGHWYANFGYYAGDQQRKAYRALGRLCKLNVRTGELTNLIDDRQGTVRDPQVHYDGRKIVFSYRRGGSDSFHLYEINVDGTGLRQLTHGPYNDIEPTYLADGGILFCSDRCNRWVNCWLTQVAVLYRCNAEGGEVELLRGLEPHVWLLCGADAFQDLSGDDDNEAVSWASSAGEVVRLDSYGVKTKSYTQEGGMQAQHSQKERAKMERAACYYLVRRYPRLIRLNTKKKSLFTELSFIRSGPFRK